MTRYSYPAIFSPAEEGGYTVNFPDLEGCFTEGDTLTEAIYMAEDVLALILYGYETDGRSIPAPSDPGSFDLHEGDFVNYIACDTMEYRKMYNNKSIKKTLSIPEWLNEKATSMNLNFSQILQEALIEKINAQWVFL